MENINYLEEMFHPLTNSGSNNKRKSQQAEKEPSPVVVLKDTTNTPSKKIRNSQEKQASLLISESPTIDYLKSQSSSVAEEILSIISVHQKELREKNVQKEKMDNIVGILKAVTLTLEHFNIAPMGSGLCLASPERAEAEFYAIAKKILQISGVIGKLEGVKRGEALLLVLNCIKQSFTEGIKLDHKDIPDVPIEMLVSLMAPSTPVKTLRRRTTFLLPNPLKDNTTSDGPYKTGYLIKRSKHLASLKSSRKRWCVLSDSNLSIFKSSVQTGSKKVIALKDIVSIKQWRKDNGFIVESTQYTVKLLCDSETEAACWMLAIDTMIRALREGSSEQKLGVSSSSSSSTLKRFSTISRKSSILGRDLSLPLTPSMVPLSTEVVVISKEERSKLLQLAHLQPFTSGTIKSSTYDEEWGYKYSEEKSVSTIFNVSWGTDILHYKWNGEWLWPVQGTQMSLGVGYFDGGYLLWYSPESVNIVYTDDESKANITVKSEPFIRYLYVPHLLGFIAISHNDNPSMTWTWSRHFLFASSSQETGNNSTKRGEWLKEGKVPEVIVMLLQMMRYYRTGR
eukprot:TRINITY_DN2303_c0_g1_i1.p1 TRINITY_DN2303_c0_g1~~TRINITY_DN2303_c0_g1_i1.p1  ORF type:complete len:567 (+),score=105.04 TRINITY_DN2303_c0_g1_i1:207-1907(+)